MTVTFPSKEEVALVLQNTPYFFEMSVLDLRARGAESADAYLAKYLRSVVALSQQQQARVAELASGVDAVTKPFKRLHAIPWKVAAFQGIEHEFPHTHADVIFLPLDMIEDPAKGVMETMLHEKIHIYQRLFPLETNVLVQKVWGYKMHSLRKRHALARNNPDLNPVVYGKRKWGMLQEFTKTANSLRDSKHTVVGEADESFASEMYEHPFERMAYEVSRQLMSMGATKIDRALQEWMATYF